MTCVYTQNWVFYRGTTLGVEAMAYGVAEGWGRSGVWGVRLLGFNTWGVDDDRSA